MSNRTPTKILELKGAFKKNPNRKREGEPIVDVKFESEPPVYFSDEQKECWHELVGLVPAGVLTGADKIQVEITACLLAEFRGMKGGVATDRITRLCTEMGKLGLNPSARASLSVEKPKGNKFSE